MAFNFLDVIGGPIKGKIYGTHRGGQGRKLRPAAPPSDRVTNRKFMEQDEAFKKSCEAINIPVTKRQASKWRAGKGLAFKSRVRGN